MYNLLYSLYVGGLVENSLNFILNTDLYWSLLLSFPNKQFCILVLPRKKVPVTCVTFSQGKRTNLRKTGSERIGHGMRVKFNPLALLLDSSLEGEFDLVQRIIYEVQTLT